MLIKLITILLPADQYILIYNVIYIIVYLNLNNDIVSCETVYVYFLFKLFWSTNTFVGHQRCIYMYISYCEENLYTIHNKIYDVYKYIF